MGSDKKPSGRLKLSIFLVSIVYFMLFIAIIFDNLFEFPFNSFHLIEKDLFDQTFVKPDLFDQTFVKPDFFNSFNNQTQNELIKLMKEIFYRKNSFPRNPFTNRSVLFFSIISLDMHEITMNFCCSLAHINFNPDSLIFFTFEYGCYADMKRNKLPSYYLDFQISAEDQFIKFANMRVLLCKLFLYLDIEVCYSDVDIMFFDTINDYLFCPQLFDVAFWSDGGSDIIKQPLLPSYVYQANSGFIRLFPTQNANEFLTLWLEYGLDNPTLMNQKCLQDIIQNEIQCTYIKDMNPPPHDFAFHLMNDRQKQLKEKMNFWNCKFNNKREHSQNFILHQYPELNMVTSCQQPSTFFRSFKKFGVIPGMFHLICLKGLELKMKYLDNSKLWFFDRNLHQCSAESSAERWRRYFTTNETSLIEQDRSPLPKRGWHPFRRNFAINEDIVAWIDNHGKNISN